MIENSLSSSSLLSHIARIRLDRFLEKRPASLARPFSKLY
jgi:hypothetical protein